jgi:hypothetical protein
VQLTEAGSGTVAWADAFVLPAEFPVAGVLEPVVQRIVATIGDIFGVLASIVWQRAGGKPTPDDSDVWPFRRLRLRRHGRDSLTTKRSLTGIPRSLR